MAGFQMEFVKRKIVQYIHEERLRDGDRLPSQRVLCATLQVGAATVSTALKELAGEEILEIRDKVGVLVRKPDADGRTGRAIGITPGRIQVSLYNCCLLHHLQQYLLLRGCRPVIFYCTDQPEIDGFELDTFPGLRRGIERHEVDAVLDLTQLSAKARRYAARQNISICRVGLYKSAVDTHVFYHLGEYLNGAIARLQRLQCENIAVICPNDDEAALVRTFESVRRIDYAADVATACRWVEKIAELPSESRPDGVVVFDDMVALAITSQLMRRGGEMPWIVTLGSRQIPLEFASERVIVALNDLELMAQRAVDLLLAKLQGKTPNSSHESIAYQWSDNDNNCGLEIHEREE